MTTDPTPDASPPDGEAEPDQGGAPSSPGGGDDSPPPGGGAKHARQAGILVLGTTLATLSGVVVPLLVVRLIGKADVAALMALLLVYETVTLIVTAGFPQTLMYHLPARSLAERRAVARRIASTLMLLGLGAGVLLAGVAGFGNYLTGIFAHSSKQSVDLRPVLALAVMPLGDLPARMLPNLLVVENRARAASVVGVLRSIARTLATLVPLALGYGVWTVALCITVTGLLHGLLVVYFLGDVYRGAEPVECPISRRELFSFAIPLGTTDIVSMLNNGLDRYLILLAFPAAAFADYQAGAWQVPVISYVPYAVGIAFAPRFVELFKAKKPREALAIWQHSIEKVSLIVLPSTAVFVVGAEELMQLLFTHAYIGAAPVFRLYSILTLGRVAAFGNVIVAAGRPRYVLQAAVLSLGSNLLISVPLVFTLGFTGPALGTVLAFIPTVLFYCWCIGRASDVPMREVFPLKRYGRVLFLCALAAVPATLFKLEIHASVALKLLGEAVLLLGTFSLLGTLAKIIERDDWAFAYSWIRLKVLR